MRVREIRVNGLFGMFNHHIRLNEDPRVTVLHGPNGVGKTTVLKLVEYCGTGDYSGIKGRKFDSMDVVVLDPDGQPSKVTFVRSVDEARNTTLVSSLDALPGLAWSLARSKQGKSVIYKDIWRMQPPERGVPDGLTRSTDRLAVPPLPRFPVLAVLTDRLQVLVEDWADDGLGSDEWHPAVEVHSAALVAMIESALATYAELSQSLDRSFPSRVLDSNEQSVQVEDLQRRLEALEAKRRELHAVGLLDGDPVEAPRWSRATDPARLVMLHIFVDDTEKKLAALDDLAGRIGLMMEILNRRLLYKRLSVSREHGFVITMSNGDDVPLRELSSGEQHELIQLFRLLFDTQPDTLVLIDEPELSLHVSWQQHYLDDLIRIARLAKIDVLVATHSPDIIAERWDLTVELSGPKP